jgi:serine phosphatase RsbU (regulator of sigma subunit)
VTVTSAGHLPPLIISGTNGEYLEGEVGPPIGVQGVSAYAATTVAAPSAATFLAFTDGLVERRDKPLDDSLARLRAAASENHMGLADLLSTLVQLRREPADDDTAIVGLRWSV